MGERAHLGHKEQISLATHVQDVVAVIELEDLHDVVLCGASYGGMAVTGAADQVPDRIKLLVYVDALVPRDGRCALDLLPEGFGASVRASLDARGPTGRVPIPPDLLEALLPTGSLPDPLRDAYVARIRDHPVLSFTEPLRLAGNVDRVPRAFVRCTAGRFTPDLGDPIEACAARARAEGWAYRELAAPHDPQVFNPTEIARILGDLATAPLTEPER
jgi:pimeloyl-ACP methyl ester carboxylesterase